MWSALAIVFAESVSDFGVADTLANDAHFPVATYSLYNAVQAFPIQFSVAAAVGWVLLGLVALALLAQGWALRSRSYRVLGGRTRPARRLHLSGFAKLGAVTGMLAVLVIGIGVPAFGAVSASLINGLGSLHHQSRVDARQLQSGAQQPGSARSAHLLGAARPHHRDRHHRAGGGGGARPVAPRELTSARGCST